MYQIITLCHLSDLYKLDYFLAPIALNGTAGLLGLSANVKGRTFQYVSFYNFFVGSKKNIQGSPPKKICPLCPSKSASIIIMRKSESNRLISIYCFHLFCHFLFLYNFNFLLSVNFSETIWILSFLSDICDVTLACYDGGNFKQDKF